MYNSLKTLQLHFKRYFSSKPLQKLEKLTNRKIIRVAGDEASSFLQGLITNDMRHLENNVGCMYAMFLNTKGRILYDTLIYRCNEPNSFLVECDLEVVSSLQRHLKMYRVRRKIDVDSLENDIDVYALFNPLAVELSNKDSLSQGDIVPCNILGETQPKTTVKVINNVQIYRDPRISELGYRLLAPTKTDITSEIKSVATIDETVSLNTYRWCRYSLGVGEGVIDLPPNNCFPLEANGDFLHGVSFHKGCYIGQELTARTYHTGVIRKRLMPLIFNETIAKLDADTPIIHEKINLGKFRGFEGNVGLALLRIAQAVEIGTIKIGNISAKTMKPTWWPVEAPKEKMNA